jgi:hypothetical protein
LHLSRRTLPKTSDSTGHRADEGWCKFRKVHISNWSDWTAGTASGKDRKRLANATLILPAFSLADQVWSFVMVEELTQTMPQDLRQAFSKAVRLTINGDLSLMMCQPPPLIFAL